MPDVDEHKSQAEHNERFFRSFYRPNSNFLDWAVTVLFYQAVHLVEAYLARNDIHSGSHAERLRYVGESLSSIYVDFRRLYGESRRTRYDVDQPSQEEFDRLVQNHFQPLQRYLNERIS